MSGLNTVHIRRSNPSWSCGSVVVNEVEGEALGKGKGPKLTAEWPGLFGTREKAANWELTSLLNLGEVAAGGDGEMELVRRNRTIPKHVGHSISFGTPKFFTRGVSHVLVAISESLFVAAVIGDGGAAVV